MRIFLKKNKCVGCEICTMICNYTQVQTTGLEEGNIKILRNYPKLTDPLFKAYVCLHCNNAKCIEACVPGALYKEGTQVELDRDLCTGCGDCVSACPFDAIWISPLDGKAHKCDLCKGNPKCVEWCPHDALEMKK